ncbi:MAG: hypothetical protein JXX28_13825 [Deltaproteobacteria bacterium]|nr:hypothetical protein [Deltaproteobacteria bacterium]
MPTNESLAEVLDKAWETKPLTEIVKASPEILQGVSQRQADLLKEAFKVNTIEELANLKFVRWAQALVTLSEMERL